MSAESLPPDVQAARKTRINSDLIAFCSHPAPAYLRPKALGIGLYTHVAGPRLTARNPHAKFADKVSGEVALLPIGGPKEIVPSKSRQTPAAEVAALYNDLCAAVKAETQIWHDMRAAADAKGDAPNEAYKMSLQTLKARYGDVNAVGVESTAPLVHAQQNKRSHSEVEGSVDEPPARKRKVSFAPQPTSRRTSADVFTLGIMPDAETREFAKKAGNTYEEDRDPRRRGR